jgi:hypothetical protein
MVEVFFFYIKKIYFWGIIHEDFTKKSKSHVNFLSNNYFFSKRSSISFALIEYPLEK